MPSEIASVKGTALDFTSPHKIGERHMQTGLGGYDHNFVLRGGVTAKPRLAARVYEPKTGRVLEMFTTEPGVQLYTANYLNMTQAKGGAAYGRHQGFCLEAQHFPDSVHHPSFPSTILKPGETYRQTTVYKFSVQ